MTTRIAQAAEPGLRQVPDDVFFGVALYPPAMTWTPGNPAPPASAVVDGSGILVPAGVVRIVTERGFVGVVATSASAARDAASRLEAKWPGASEIPADADSRALDHVGAPYVWAWSSGSDGWATARADGDSVDLWTNASEGEALRLEICALTGLGPSSVTIRCTGIAAQSDVFDAAAAAVVMSRAVGRPVRVLAEPSHVAHRLVLRVQGTRAADGSLATHALATDGVPLARPSLARLLSSHASPEPAAADPAPFPYEIPTTLAPAPASVRVGPPLAVEQFAAGEVFANESFIDEEARRSRQDPVAYRLERLNDDRSRSLIERVSQQANWASDLRASRDDVRVGRGFAFARMVDPGGPHPASTLSAWVVEVEVDDAGVVSLPRVVAGCDRIDRDTLAGGTVAIEGQVRREVDRLLEGAAFGVWRDRTGTALSVAPSGTRVDLVAQPNSIEPTRMAWGAAASLPIAAAVANAVFDATGVRLREPPFNSASARAALALDSPRSRRRRLGPWLAGAVGALSAAFISLLPSQKPIAPLSAAPSAGIYSPATVERGRLMAAVGDCVVCHTAAGGEANAGGLALPTPFGTVYSTNITPDPDTGIGLWSFTAFERAMREGVGRDGKHLYPAFPYTAFAKVADEDMQALYAYLMSRPAVRNATPHTKLNLPVDARPLLGAWKLLFHDNRPMTADRLQSTEWNRGRYLVDGLGHCGACHTPRNALGAEKAGVASYLAGGSVEGWDAPPLNGSGRSPLPWTSSDLFEYLRFGFAPRHGVASGPMAPVVQELSALPDSDVRAMAFYLASLSPSPVAAPPGASATAKAIEAAAISAASKLRPGGRGEGLFRGACASCHEQGQGPALDGVRLSLALNTNLHADSPSNLIQLVLRGIPTPAQPGLGYMPAFHDSLNDTQVADLLAYLRRRFAPDKPAWKDLSKAVQRTRAPHDRPPPSLDHRTPS